MNNSNTSGISLEISNSYQSAFTGTLLEVTFYEGKIKVLTVIDDSIGDVIENFLDDDSIEEEFMNLNQGIQRGEKYFSFEYMSSKTKCSYIVKAVYIDELYQSQYPIFRLYIYDVTALNAEIEEEKKNSIEFEHLTDAVSIGVLKLSLKEGYPVLWSNGTFLKNVGFSSYEIKKQFHNLFLDIVSEQDQERFITLMEQSFETKEIKTGKITLLDRNRQHQLFEVKVIPNKDSKETDLVCYCVISIMTKDKEREQELKSFEERYKKVLSFTSEIVFEYDLETDVMHYFGGEQSSLHRPTIISNYYNKMNRNELPNGRLTEESQEEIMQIITLFKINKVESTDAYICYEMDNHKLQWVYLIAKCIFSEKNEAMIVVGKLTDVTVHKEVEHKLRIKASTDALTKVSNREYAQEEIQKYINSHDPSMLSALFIVDVDNFKNINDYYGHMVGDQALTKLSKVLQKEFRSTDIVGRLGGDEFIVFIKDVKSADVIYRKADAICHKVKQNIGMISVSVGYSIYDGISNFEELYRTADIALYQAKIRGKNTSVCYNDLTEENMLSKEAEHEGKDGMPNILGVEDFNTIICNRFAKSILDTYDYIYAVNLTKDRTVRFNESVDPEDEHYFETYTEMFEHIENELLDAEEKSDFILYFQRDNLLKSFTENERFIHRYIRIFNQKQEFHWYFAEAVLQEMNDQGDILCTVMFKDVQKSRSDEMRKYETRTKSHIIQQLEDEKSIDSLTGLYQTSKFYEIAKSMIWSNVSKKYAIISFDIDSFRVINDIYSEETGNQIICYIADVLRRLNQEDKVFCRYYADCFTILMNYESREDIIRTIDWIRTESNAAPYINTTFHMSFGVYLVMDPNIPIRLMCDWARLATRTIKGLTNQYYAFYNEEYRKELVETQKIEAEMNSALKNEEFKMYLQPKYNLRTNEVVGAEALVRWHHPKQGIIYPNKFIKLFEKNGFILKLDEYMWEQACKELRKWLDVGFVHPISVNISRLHTYDPGLVQKLLHLVEKYQIPVNMLELEFTEGLFMENVQMLYGLMHDLKRNGFVLQMDDFGSGFSSLNMLKSVPIDVIKLDKAFFEDITENERGKIIIEDSIKMIHNLNLEVMAEGIETKENVDFLNQCDCVVGQGYFYAKPMALEEFESRLVHKEEQND